MKPNFDKLTIGVKKETYQIFKRESATLGISMAEFVRRRIKKFPIEAPANSGVEDQEKPRTSRFKKSIFLVSALSGENPALYTTP